MNSFITWGAVYFKKHLCKEQALPLVVNRKYLVYDVCLETSISMISCLSTGTLLTPLKDFERFCAMQNCRKSN